MLYNETRLSLTANKRQVGNMQFAQSILDKRYAHRYSFVSCSSSTYLYFPYIFAVIWKTSPF